VQRPWAILREGLLIWVAASRLMADGRPLNPGPDTSPETGPDPGPDPSVLHERSLQQILAQCLSVRQETK
jgi:hypothetical protein